LLIEVILHFHYGKMHEMRDPITKFPQRPTGLDHTRRTLAEIQTVLKNPRLSPEMRNSLEQRVTALRIEIAAATEPRARDSSPSR
jgi:hypothetical protein